MRRIRFGVAMSLDGYIAGPNGEADWIIADPEIDFAAIFAQFDTLVMGRKTFERMVEAGQATMHGMKIVVFSKTLRAADYPDTTILRDKMEENMSELRAAPGKDIWLFGGGSLFRSFLEKGLVDMVEVAVIPVLLGQGISLLPAPAKRESLELVSQDVHKKTGIVRLTYNVKKVPVMRAKKK